MAEDWTVEFDDAALRFLHDNWFAVANTAFRNMADAAVEEAKANISPSKSGLHVRSGKLRESVKLGKYIQPSPESEGTATLRAGNSKVPYAAIHEKGGVIRAKNKKYLTFKINGKWYKKTSVTIPARPYLQPAVDDVVAKVEEYLQDALRTIYKEA